MKKILKNKENSQFSNSNIFIFITMILCIVFIIAFIIFFSKSIFATSQVYNEELEIEKLNLSDAEENLNIFNLEEIIKNIPNQKIEKELIVEKRVLEYTTIYKENSELPKGVMQVIQEGRDGEEEVITLKIYENQELKEEKQVKENLIKASINKIVEIGTSSKKYNMNPQIRRYNVCYSRYIDFEKYSRYFW